MKKFWLMQIGILLPILINIGPE